MDSINYHKKRELTNLVHFAGLNSIPFKRIIAGILLLIFCISFLTFLIKPTKRVEVDHSNLGIQGVQPQNTLNDAHADQSVVADTSIETSKTPIVVHVAGEVVNPGVYTLHTYDRIDDAIRAAGGVTSSAILDDINLAQPLSDGSRVLIPNESNRINADQMTPHNNSVTAENSSHGKVNINIASSEELQTIPGIGEKTAQKILDDRKLNGRYTSINDLERISGIGSAKVESMRDYVVLQ